MIVMAYISRNAISLHLCGFRGSELLQVLRAEPFPEPPLPYGFLLIRSPEIK